MLVFPTRLFAPGSMSPDTIGGTVAGGSSLGGVAQLGEMSGGGLWSIGFSDINLLTREKVLAWRAVSAALRNGATPVIVPLADRRHQPINSRQTTTPFDDLTLWDDAVAWDQAEVDAVVTTLAALRATTLHFTFTAPKPLIGGEHFSILHGSNIGWRMHRVEQVVSGGLGSGDATVIQFSPPLRAQAAVDTPLNFDSPRVVCQAAKPLVSPLDLLRFGKGEALFVEAFPASLG